MNKTNETALLAFANIIYDTVGLSRLVDQINLVERSLFKAKPGTISDKARDYLSGNVISVFEQIEKAGLEPTDDQGQLQFLKDLLTYLSNLLRVKVTVAFEPTYSFVMKLNNQISEVLGKKVIVDLTIDESVVGGAVFEFRGKSSDFTLKNKLNAELAGQISQPAEKIAPL